jgi:hypothetical protein
MLHPTNQSDKRAATHCAFTHSDTGALQEALQCCRVEFAISVSICMHLSHSFVLQQTPKYYPRTS